jgi:uncharacterized membrane protein YdjX (TVP38/TMEM64 family)
MKNKPRKGEPAAQSLRLLPVAAVTALLAFAWLAGWFDNLSLSALIRHRDALAAFVEQNWLLALLAYGVIYAALVAISFPGAAFLTIIAGFLFGGPAAGSTTVVAATAGACAIFAIARTSLGNVLAERAGPFVRRMVAGFNRDAFSYLLTLRLTPLFPFWVVNIVPALLNMRLRDYAAATFLGIIPGTFAYAYVGAGLDSVIAAQEAANPGCADAGTCHIEISSLVTPQILYAMTALAIVALLPVIVRRLFGSGPAGRA